MIEVDLNICINEDGNNLLNRERVALLRCIQSSGSLLLASREMGISYNKTWKMIAEMNQATHSAMVEKVRGGRGGGGATLTAFGKLVLSEYDYIEHQVYLFKEKINIEIQM